MAESIKTDAVVGNGKWYAPGNVLRFLFWFVFLIISTWGTYVWTRAETANTKADQANATNAVQDESLRNLKETCLRMESTQNKMSDKIDRIFEKITK